MKEQDERIERLLECYFDARTTDCLLYTSDAADD